MRRVAIDTEFIERGHQHPIDLVSIGLVDVDGGDEYYAVSAEFDQTALLGDPWLWRNVAGHLPWNWVPSERYTTGSTVQLYPAGLDLEHPAVKRRDRIAVEVAEFLLAGGGPVQTWADHSAHDHVVMSQLWGRMVDMPAGVPWRTHDIRQYADMLGCEASLPRQEGVEHHALADAHYVASCLRYLDRVVTAAHVQHDLLAFGEAHMIVRSPDPQPPITPDDA